MRQSAASAFERGLEQRTQLAPGDGVRRARRRRGPRRRIRATAARAACSPMPSTPSAGPADDPAWTWPEARLSYANAALAEALIAAGALLERPDVLDDGLTALRWLLDRETRRRPPVADRRRRCRPGRPAAACSTSSRSRRRRWPTPAHGPSP